MFELNGMDFVQESESPFCISITPNEKNVNVNGTIHGGILFLICDEIVGRYVSGQGIKGAAADSDIHFYRPALPNEKIFATISERKVGKKLGVYLVELKNPAGKALADAVFTVAFAG